MTPAPLDQRVTLWRICSYAFALSVTLGLGYFIFQMPLQVSDNVANIMRVKQLTWRGILESEFRPGFRYLRPMLWLAINCVFELAHGSYFLIFKSLHVLQLGAVLLLFVRALNVRTAWDAAVSALAVVSLVGIHTFFGTVNEGYPINHYMTILLACILAVNLSFGQPTAWRDALAVALFAFALLTLETGVLVFLCLAVGYATGFRGVSVRGLSGCGVVLVSYLLLRLLFQSSLPLDERSSGFGFRAYDPSELQRIVGARRFLFSCYNVACSVLTVFFAEPRAGTWRLLRDLSQRPLSVEPALVLNVLTSSLSSLFILAFAWTRRRQWLERRFDHGDRLVLVFLTAVLGNAVISFPYTKDVIVSPAGLLYSLALFAAVRQMPLSGEQLPRRTLLRRLGPWLLALVSLGWTLRAIGVPYGLWYTAFKYQREWIHIDEWRVAQKLDYDSGQLELLAELRAEALQLPVPNPHELGAWGRWGRWAFDLP